MSRFNVFKFRENGEDDGTRRYDDNGYIICNRCGTRMNGRYSPKDGVDYFICPKCKFIEIDSYDDEADDEDYELYWPDSDEDADDLEVYDPDDWE